MRFSSLSLEQLPAWAHLNDVKFYNASVVSQIIDASGIDKGGGILSTSQQDGGQTLVSIPRDLILSKEQVENYAKTDKNLRDILAAVGEFAQNVRKSILLFLLLQLTYTSPDVDQSQVGSVSPLTDYVKFLPKSMTISPTFYTAEQRQLLVGTSLENVLAQKTISLEREFETLREATSQIEWCRRTWWDEETGCLTFEDWKLVDSLYRSRGLELPTVHGEAMVPVVDMANHAPGGKCNAYFDVNVNGQVVMVVDPERAVDDREEVTITYGFKGACEMLFSYGFLDEEVEDAKDLLLGLEIPRDDPLCVPKRHLAKQPPCVRIYRDETGKVRWDSGLVWWSCINEEDGLDIRLLQTTDGQREIQAMWKGEPLDPARIQDVLMSDALADVFRLRATVMVQQRVELQGERLTANQSEIDQKVTSGPQEGFIRETICRLRDVEMRMLEASFTCLESEKAQLLQSRVVSDYLGQVAAGPPGEMEEEEDFS